MSALKYRGSKFEIVDQSKIESGTPIMFLSKPKNTPPKSHQGYAYKNGNNMRVVAFVQDGHGGWITKSKTPPAEEQVAILRETPAGVGYDEAMRRPRMPFVTDPRLVNNIQEELLASRQPPARVTWSCNIM